MSDYTPTESDIQRFWDKVDRKGENECWEWQGCTNNLGYGFIKINRRVRRTHRISWELIYGEIPDGLHVCHHCDNRKCCNPKHLFLGTHQENMQDRDRKGRQALKRPRSPQKTGSGAYFAKLTDEQVRELRLRCKNEKGLSYKQLANDYGIHRQTLYRIIKRITYKFVSDE